MAFAPLMFQAARAARNLGVLEALEPDGRTAQEVERATGLSPYAVELLLDSCDALDLVERSERGFRLKAAGWLLVHDGRTRVNMDFANDVCWKGAGHLEEALRTGTPAGLHELVDAPTIYEGLARLPPEAQASWLRFDHFYSDQIFPRARPHVLKRGPRNLLDVGGNTGRWAQTIAADVPVTILDHAGQIEVALANARRAGLGDRVAGVAFDLLDHDRAFPKGFDAVWMSQFLCCFAPEDILRILVRAREALTPPGRLYVVDTFWDRQPNAVARFCVHATSLYFACMANGRSRMYGSRELQGWIEKAGFELEADIPLGLSHTLYVARPV
ncbi:MAG: class I SAM-dependent methyltransferase [Myxococcales bacterium]